MGALILIVGLLIFMPRPPANMEADFAKNNGMMKEEAAKAPFKTIAWRKASAAKKKIAASNEGYAKTLNITIFADMSVCGVSAAIATAAACRAKKEELTLDLAWNVVTEGGKSAIEKSEWMTSLHGDLRRPYSLWMVALTEYYSIFLQREGASFTELVRGRYRNRSEYLLALNRLNSAERGFYAALKPQMKAMDGAAEIIAVVEKASRSLRREMAERIFP